jgi:hypothetical protein
LKRLWGVEKGTWETMELETGIGVWTSGSAAMEWLFHVVVSVEKDSSDMAGLATSPTETKICRTKWKRSVGAGR